MAEITIYDFVAWLREQIAPEDISALVTEYGHTDDSSETIILALRDDSGFAEDMGGLLGKSLESNKVELNRSIGGVNIESNSLSAKDWKRIAKSGSVMDHADGESSLDTATKEKFDWGSLVTTVLTVAGGVASSIWGTKNPATPEQSTTSGSGSSTALYIIIAVVVVAVIAILWVSLAGKK